MPYYVPHMQDILDEIGIPPSARFGFAWTNMCKKFSEPKIWTRMKCGAFCIPNCKTPHTKNNSPNNCAPNGKRATRAMKDWVK